MSGPRTPFNLWMATAKSGDSIYTARTDVSVHSDAARHGKLVTTERGVFVSGTNSCPTAEPLTRVTMRGDKR